MAPLLIFQNAVIDFDAAGRDPNTLTNLLSAYNSGDGLHLNPAGYHAMANKIDLTLFNQWEDRMFSPACRLVALAGTNWAGEFERH